jgi:ATP adenylyltransferase
LKKIWAPWRGEYLKKDKKNYCVFCYLSQSKLSKENLVLYKTKHSYVVMNKFPYNNGHILVIPNSHIDSFDNLNEKEYLDLSYLLKQSIAIVKDTINPQAINIGMNLGKEAGAGIYDHLHYHVVPRWDGDTNFMPIIAETKLISEHLNTTYDKLYLGFKNL